MSPPPRAAPSRRRPRRAAALTREQWADAALEALGDGVEALAVEPLARRLGVTKGSFYWHFEDRSALLRAALERWEAVATEDYIRQLDTLPSPRRRLEALLSDVLAELPHQRIEVAIAAASAQREVRPVLARVSARRIAYLDTLYRGLGVGAAHSRFWALHAYSAYVGLLQLIHSSPEALGSARLRAGYRSHLLRVLLPP